MTEMTEMTDMTITEMVEITEMTLRTEITKMPDMTDMTIDEKDGIYDLDDLDNCRVQCLQSSISAKLARAACMRCHGTKCPLLTAFFLSFFFSSPTLTFLPEGVIVGFQNFAWGFKSQKK